MSNILIDIEGGQAVMVWSDSQEPMKVFVRYAPGDIRSCLEWSHDKGKHIEGILTDAGLFCDHCEEFFTPEQLVHDSESDGKYCKHCHKWLAELAEIEAERAEEERAEAKGCEI